MAGKMWHSIDEPYDEVGTFPIQLTQTYDPDYACPKCGEACQYEEGQIDQDRMGNDIDGWWFTCYSCRISCEAVEGSWND